MSAFSQINFLLCSRGYLLFSKYRKRSDDNQVSIELNALLFLLYCKLKKFLSKIPLEIACIKKIRLKAIFDRFRWHVIALHTSIKAIELLFELRKSTCWNSISDIDPREWPKK